MKLTDQRRLERRRRKVVRLAKAVGIVLGICVLVALWCAIVITLFNLFGAWGVFWMFAAIFIVGMVSLVYGELDD